MGILPLIHEQNAVPIAMKLHLPKKLSIAIVSAFASLSAQSAEFSGTIYTWNGDMYNRDDIAYGQFYVTTYDGDTATVHTDQALEPNSSSDWSPISAVFCRSGYTGTLATMRFDGSYGTSRPTARLNFSPFNVAGIIVEEGAVGYSVVSNRESRPVNIGNMNGEASYSLIKEDFTLAQGEITIYGPNTFNVATNKTFRLTTGVSLAGDLTITGGGMVEYAQGCMTMDANSSIVVNTGSSMSCSSGLMMTSSATISNNGTLELDGTIKLGGAGIENNGSVMLGSNVVFDLSQLTAQDNSYKLFSGTSQVDLSQYDYTIDNIAGIPFKEGYAWTFGSNGTISYHALDVYEWTGSEHEWVAGGTGWTRNGETVTYPTMDEVHALFPKAASPECVMSVDVHGTVTASILEIGDSYTFNLTDSASVTPMHIQIGNAGTEVNFTGSGEVRAGDVYASGSTISLAKGVVMRVNDVSVGGAELTGDGTFVLPYGESGMHGFTLGNDWTGMVRIGGFSASNSTHLDNFANGSLSTVEICGITGGYLPEYAGGTVGVDIKLTNPGSNTPAWIWDNGSGYSNYTITFTGDWSGNGTFQKTAYYNQSFTFTGNISEWRGAFEFTTGSGHTSNLTFQGNATEVNAAISKPGSGTLNVVAGDGTSDFRTAFKNIVEASSLTIAEHATAVLEDSATFSDGVHLHGTLELGADANLSVGNKVSMDANHAAGAVISGNIEITDAKMNGTKGKGSLSYVHMTTKGDYTIEDMSISGSLIDVGEGTKLYLVNVDIHSDTHITDEAAWLDMQATNAWLDENNAHVMGRHVTTENTTLYLSGDPSQAITMAAGRVVVELTSDMFDTVTMTGGEPGVDLWLDMTAIADAFEGADYVALDFRDLAREFSNAMVDVEKLQVNVTLDGETYKQAYAMTDHGTTTTLYFAVPEPTTSTLSLLALAALAARRRRTLSRHHVHFDARAGEINPDS